jgi:hypothetical protein
MSINRALRRRNERVLRKRSNGDLRNGKNGFPSSSVVINEDPELALMQFLMQVLFEKS